MRATVVLTVFLPARMLARYWELERYGRVPKGCAIVMMDLDDFKKLNDTYGHPAGDAALRSLARLLAHMQRDKKRARGGVRWVLTPRMGSASVPRLISGRLVRAVLLEVGART